MKLALLLVAIPLFAQDDISAVRLAVDPYVKGSDVAAQRKAFHPEAKLFVADGKGGVRIIPVAEFLANVEKSLATTAPPHRVLDAIEVTGTVAVARVSAVMNGNVVTDYLSLVRAGNDWVIVNKTFHVAARQSP